MRTHEEIITWNYVKDGELPKGSKNVLVSLEEGVYPAFYDSVGLAFIVSKGEKLQEVYEEEEVAAWANMPGGVPLEEGICKEHTMGH